MKSIFYFSWIFMIFINSAISETSGTNIKFSKDQLACPCNVTQWCNVITDVSRKEVFAFSIDNDESHWNLFDWTKLTTIVMFGYINSDLMCLAHSHNVRVVILGNVNEATFTDPTKRQAWISQQYNIVKTNFLDGLNFDFEGAVAQNEVSVRDAYTALVRETNTYFKQELPYSQISVDVGWKANVDVRFFDYQGLADNSDLLFVMAYDEQSQIFGECLAGPNSAVAAAAEGLDSYLMEFGNISPNKLVLGIPWYGYIYPCLKIEGDKCYIREVPFRGVNCSDAAGGQYDYIFIHKLLQTMPENYRWNVSSSTPYITYQNPVTNLSYQIQYDDPQSLKIKYDLADKMGLRGVGMWNIDSLDYSDSSVGRAIRDAMFGALPSYNGPNRTFAGSSGLKSKCPCSNPDWCNPITDTKRKEVYAFCLANDENYWNKFDWSKITTICMYGYVNTSLMCLAHSHNVRVVSLGIVQLITMITPALREIWISEQLQIVQDNFLDGLNFDVEMTITPQQKEISDAYTALVTETSTAFKKALPYSQISVDVIHDAFSKLCAYDYPALAAAVDFLFIMAYDEYGFSQVGPNSDFTITNQSIDSYIKSNISTDKLVLGLPWYGYIYECAKLIEDNCTMNSSKQGQSQQYIYVTLVKLLETMPEKYRWNVTSCTPYFTYTNSVEDMMNQDGKAYQIQYDDPKSLKIKYDLAASRGLRGVGMWAIDYLDYSDTAKGEAMRQAMFAQLPSHGGLSPH